MKEGKLSWLRVFVAKEPFGLSLSKTPGHDASGGNNFMKQSLCDASTSSARTPLCVTSIIPDRATKSRIAQAMRLGYGNLVQGSEGRDVVRRGLDFAN